MRTLAIALWFLWVLAIVATAIAGMVTWRWIERTF